MGQDKSKVSGPDDAGQGRRATADILPLIIILAVYLVLAGLYLSAPGLAWDEALIAPWAEEKLRWFEGLPGSWSWEAFYGSVGRLTSHPPLFQYQTALAIKLFGDPVGTLFAARIASAVSMAGLLAAVYFFTLRTVGAVAAAAATIFLTAIPQVFEHSIMATCDAAISLWWFAAAALFYAAMHNRRLAWAAGLAAAFAFLTKINAIALPLVLWPWGLYSFGRRALPAIVWTVILVPTLFYALYPAMWPEPFVGAGKYLGDKFGFVVTAYSALGIDLKTAGDAAHRMLQRTEVPVLFFGHVYARAPWHYAVVMTLITTPVAVIAWAASGAARLLKLGRPGLMPFLAWNIVFWLGAFSVGLGRPYDGTRLFAVIFPFVAVMAGSGFEAAWMYFPKTKAGRGLLGVAAVATVASLSLAFFPIQPFGMSYYNSLVGGLPGAAERGLSVTYWGETADSEITAPLNGNAGEGARVAAFPMDSIYVENLRFFGLIRPDMRNVSYKDDWDYLIVANRGDALASRPDVVALTKDATVTKRVQGVPAAWLVQKKR